LLAVGAGDVARRTGLVALRAYLARAEGSNCVRAELASQ